MTKTACKKDNFQDKENPKFECKRCGAKVNKNEKVCKPRKIAVNHSSEEKKINKNQFSE